MLDQPTQSTAIQEWIEFGAYRFNIWNREIVVGERKTRLATMEAILFRRLGEAGDSTVSIGDFMAASVAYHGQSRVEDWDNVRSHLFRLNNKLSAFFAPGSKLIKCISHGKYHLLQPPLS